MSFDIYHAPVPPVFSRGSNRTRHPPVNPRISNPTWSSIKTHLSTGSYFLLCRLYVTTRRVFCTSKSVLPAEANETFMASATARGQAPLMSLSDVCALFAVHPYMHYVAAESTAAIIHGMPPSLHTEELSRPSIIPLVQSDG